MKKFTSFLILIMLMIENAGSFVFALDDAFNDAESYIGDNIYILESKLSSGMVVDVAGAVSSDCVNIQLYEANDTMAQIFYISDIRDGYCTIKSLLSNDKVLDVQFAGQDSGTNVWQYTENDTDAQKWQLIQAEGEYYYIKSKVNGLYLDVSGAKTDNGANIQVYEGNGSDAQKFKLNRQSKSKDYITSNIKNYNRRKNYFRNKGILSALDTKWGIEIELTGMTRKRAEKILADVLGSPKLLMYDGRKWKTAYDSSFKSMKWVDGKKVPAGKSYNVEIVSPILTYKDIYVLNRIVEELEKNGGFVVENTGIHVHLDGKGHTPETLRTFINIFYDKQDYFVDLLNIPQSRIERHIKKFDDVFMKKLNFKKNIEFSDIETVWYNGYSESREIKYNKSRYRMFNLHCYFHGNNSTEVRIFNSCLDTKKINSYVIFSLTLNSAALYNKLELCSNQNLNYIINDLVM